MTTSSTPAPEVWFLTGSQGMYGPETLEQVAAQSQEVARELGASMPVHVVWKPVLLDAAAIHRQMLEANSAPQCVGVITWMHTFSPAKMWIAGLDALQKPLLHLHTQAGMELPWSTIDMDFMNLNQAAHGDREYGYIQTRLGIARKTVAGHVRSPDVARRTAIWARAAMGRHELRRLELVRFGDNMRNVAVTEGDKVEAQRRFGVAVNTHGVNDLVAVVDAVADADIDKLVTEYADTYAVAPELLPGGDRHDSLRYGARVELGLRQFLTEGGYGAFTTNFEDLGGLRQLPGLAVQRLMADGYGFGGEGDWKTSVLLRAAKVMEGDEPGGSSFMEDYTYHLVPGAEKVLGAHMLEVCPSIAAGRPSLEVHPLSIGGREDPVRLRFTAAPGEAVVAGPLRPRRPDAADPQRDRRGRARRGAAAAARGLRGLGAAAVAVGLGRVLADGRRAAPHGALEGGRPRGLGGLRGDDRRRGAGHRRRHHDPQVPAGAALERGVPPAGPGPVTPRTLQSGPHGPDCRVCAAQSTASNSAA